jgi:AbrB family looped-hinge helix DNA binding protein
MSANTTPRDGEEDRMKDGFAEMYFHGAVTLGERGQVVIPAEVRQRLNLHAGDRLLVFMDPAGSPLILSRICDIDRAVARLIAPEEPPMAGQGVTTRTRIDKE